MKLTSLILSAAVSVSTVSIVMCGLAGAAYQIPRGAASVEAPTILLVMNKDQFQGNWKQFKGELKKQWGKFTDNDLMQIEGSYDKFEGKVQERYGDRREEVMRWTDEWFQKQSDSKFRK